MAWQESTVDEQRARFLTLGLAEGTNVSALCRQFGISRETGHKWLRRAREATASGEPLDLADRSRQPRASPERTPPAVEAAVVALRDAHPAWGGRKLAVLLEREGLEVVPAASTVTGTLRRHGRLPAPLRPQHAVLRFEAAEPNGTWPGDVTGDRALAGGGRCYPLTLIDDHSRCCLLARACPDQTRGTVQAAWAGVFAACGLPGRILTDHGAPWGSAGAGG